VPTLDNTAHDLQWPKERISGGFDQLHIYPQYEKLTIQIFLLGLLMIKANPGAPLAGGA
jgi:hypothetical protein